MSFSGKKILVTGAAGFIGYHTAKRLLEQGATVVGVDNFSPYYSVTLKEKRVSMLRKFPKFELHTFSIAEYGNVEKVVKTFKPDWIIHLAAQAGVRYSFINPWEYATTNYLGTLNIFEAARAAGIKNVMYASSSSVYGEHAPEAFKETDRTDKPLSVYGASKIADEVLAYTYHNLSKINMIGLRFFTVCGEYGRPDMALFKFVSKLLKGEEIELYNGGKLSRSFTDVSDIVDGLCGIIEKEITGCEIYNLGGGESITVSTFMDMIQKHAGKKAKIKNADKPAADVPFTIADVSKAKKDFGFTPKVSPDEMVKRFVMWFMENQEWLLALEPGMA